MRAAPAGILEERPSKEASADGALVRGPFRTAGHPLSQPAATAPGGDLRRPSPTSSPPAARPTPDGSTPARSSSPSPAVGTTATTSSASPSIVAPTAVVVERPCPEAGRLQVLVPDTRRAYSRISHALAGDPSQGLAVFGVAGTTGKTAAALFLRAILQADGRRVGLIGASGWSDGVASYPERPADSDPGELAEMLAPDGRTPLRGRRGRPLRPPAPPPHRRRLDPRRHPDLRRPRPRSRRPLRLRRPPGPGPPFPSHRPGGPAVVRDDDPDAELLGAVNLEARRVAYTLDGPADVSALIERLDTVQTRFRLRGFDREVTVRLRLIGRRNLASALAASAMSALLGIAADAVAHGLESVVRLPGRLEHALLLAGPSPRSLAAPASRSSDRATDPLLRSA